MRNFMHVNSNMAEGVGALSFTKPFHDFGLGQAEAFFRQDFGDNEFARLCRQGVFGRNLIVKACASGDGMNAPVSPIPRIVLVRPLVAG